MAKKILVIDDETDICKTLEEILKLFDYEVSVAQSPRLAMKLLLSQPFDLILTDVNMPGMTGVDLLVKLRSAGLSYPVIFISASEEVKASAIQSGAVDFISKPFDMEDLMARIKKHC